MVDETDWRPEWRWMLLEEVFRAFPAPSAEMKTMPNDFPVRMPWGYCGNEIWNRNRQAEVAVLTAGRLAAMELLLGGANHERELERGWKNLLVGQHHDVQIVGLLPEARRFPSASIAAPTNVQDASLGFVARRMRGEGFAQVTAFNPLSWPRKQWVEVGVTLPRGSARALAVRHAGRLVPSTLIQADRSSRGDILQARLAFLSGLPPVAFESYSVTQARTPTPAVREQVGVDAPTLLIRTPFLEAQLDPQGGVASLVDRRTGAGFSEVDLLGRSQGTVSSPIPFRPWQIRTMEIKRPD